jgi:uncharacterized protein
MFGLPDATLKRIRECLEMQPEIEKASVYGSRALNTNKPGADIDIALWTKGSRDISARVKEELENLPTPYMFDVTDYRHIGYNPLKEHIDRFGKEIYTR